MKRFNQINNLTKLSKEIPAKSKLKKIYVDRIKETIKGEKAYKELCDEKDKPIDIIDKVKISFLPMDVSARTINGEIELNEELLNSPPRDILRYVVHEMTHVFQQIDGDVQEGSANKDNYLDDENEEEAFSFQLDFMEDYYDDDEIIQYLDDLLDHHNIFNKTERKEKKEELLE